MRPGRIFYNFVLLVCAFEMARLWSIMPEQLAAHFNIQGSPDRFVSKAQFFRFQLQTMLVVILVSLLSQIILLVLPPNMVNLPHREYWLAPERRDETMGRISDFGAVLFGVILLAVQSVFEVSAYANLHTPIVFDARWVGIFMVIAFAVIILMLIRLIFSFRLTSSVD